MSSSEDDEPFQLRDYDDESDEEGRPSKRRRTGRALRGKGIGFVSSTAPPQDQDGAEEENDIDDERPTMGGFRSSFNIGEFPGEAEREESPVPPMMGAQRPEQPVGGSGQSAFTPGGKIQKNSFAARMMAKQGYVEGKGLGKSSQGITAPIQATKLQSRAGLGVGSSAPEPARPRNKDKDKASRPSTPGTSTPRLKAPPKTKYTVAAIESRGLHVPDALKSVIIDATGAENRTISSLSGLSTPSREQSPGLEASKASSRIKMQLQAFSDAWDATKEQEKRLEEELIQLEAAATLREEESQKYADLISSFERVSADDSGQSREWDDIIIRLQTLQRQYSDYVSDLELPSLAIASLESPFRSQLVDWDPTTQPEHLVTSFQMLASLLEINKSLASRHRKRTTPYESLLLQHWYPHIRASLRSWSVYDPESASALLTAWTPILPSWIVYKILDELILPRLIEAVRRFPKMVEPATLSLSITNPSKSRRAPDLHSGLFDWWSLLSSSDLQLPLFP